MLQGLNCSKARRILVPWSGIEPMSPAGQGRFLTTGLPGKSLTPIFLNQGSEFPDLCSHPPNPTSQDSFWSRWRPNYFSPTCWSLCLKCSRPATPCQLVQPLFMSFMKGNPMSLRTEILRKSVVCFPYWFEIFLSFSLMGQHGQVIEENLFPKLLCLLSTPSFLCLHQPFPFCPLFEVWKRAVSMYSWCYRICQNEKREWENN